LQETCKELETNNRDLRQTVLDLKAQIKAAESKLEHSHSKINELECDLLKISEIKSQLQNKCNEFEQYNSDLKQKIADLEVSHVNKIKELEQDFEMERYGWNAKTRDLLEDMETKYDQELSEQENKLAEDLQAMFNKRIEIYVKEVDELENELKSVKLQNLDLTNIKQELLKQIKELEDQIFAQSLDKGKEIFQLKRENDDEILALKAERGIIINEYKSKVRKCRDCYMQLEIQAQALKNENERLKTQINEGNHHKREKGDEMNNAVLKELVAAESKLTKMTERFQKCKKELEEYKIITKDAYDSKKLKESNKMLCLDLDQKKAKIISLETNNASLIQEINKLRDKTASKDGSCRCKGNNKGSKIDIPVSCENTKENSENNVSTILYI
jgi:chromosome segregation ATPase